MRRFHYALLRFVTSFDGLLREKLTGAGKLAASATEGLREACLEALTCDRAQVRAFAEKFSWRACAEDFVRNLQPYPEPEKTRFWRRLRRLARVRRRPAAA